jgi:hypothetical protein
MSDAKRLLGGYATDSLTEAERRELLQAAIEDQELFDALVREDGMRELLESPGARQAVLDALDRPTAWDRARAWLQRPATVGDLAAVAAAVAIGLVALRVLSTGMPSTRPPAAATQPAPSAAPVSPETLVLLLAAPARQAVPAGLEPDGAAAAPWRVRPAARLALRVSVRGPARILVLEETPAGARQVFPRAGEPPGLVGAPPMGGPAIVHLSDTASTAPGPHRLRLVVAPAGVDLGAVGPEGLEPVLDRLSLVDLTYEVAARTTSAQERKNP